MEVGRVSISVEKAPHRNPSGAGLAPQPLTHETFGADRHQRAGSDSDAAGLERSVGAANIHFSSATDEWETPRWLFSLLAWLFGGFNLDPCATPANAKCSRFFTRAQDGLSQRWQGKVFMNPPYGRTIGLWMEKAYRASLDGALVVCLVPARVDTAWWQDYARRGHVHFLRGRLKFGAATNSAPFPSAIVIFGKCFSPDLPLDDRRGGPN
jgi:phage N-6-adenine-methyltransferase